MTRGLKVDWRDRLSDAHRALVDHDLSTLGPAVVLAPAFEKPFGLDAERHLQAFYNVAAQILRRRPAVVWWLFDQPEPGALSAVEAQAIVGEIMAVGQVVADEQEGERSLIAVQARLRTVHDVPMWTLGPADQRRDANIAKLLRRGGAAGILFLGASDLPTLHERSLAQLGHAATQGMVEFGALVRPDDDPVAQLQSLRQSMALAIPGCAVRSVRAQAREVPMSLLSGQDLDVIVWDPPHAQPTADLDSMGCRPYLAERAYLPQLFDARVPAGRWRADDPVVVTPTAMASDGRGDIRPAPDAAVRFQLAGLIDFKRKEHFFQAVADEPMLWQHYAEHLVHNWRAPDPEIRARFVDAGQLSDHLVRRHPLSAAGQSSSVSRSPRALAKSEARARLPHDRRNAMREQIQHHDYLAGSSPGAPLRADLRAFVEFLPSKLGRTVELGSGYGELARHLRVRAAFYVCLDLLPEMVHDVSELDDVYGVVADMHRLPFPSGAFDTLVANNSLEHLYDPIEALDEAARVLAADGSLFALIPLDALNPEHDLPAHRWKADRPSVDAALAASGLRIVRAQVLDLYAMGILESFPSCKGRVLCFEAGHIGGRA